MRGGPEPFAPGALEEEGKPQSSVEGNVQIRYVYILSAWGGHVTGFPLTQDAIIAPSPTRCSRISGFFKRDLQRHPEAHRHVRRCSTSLVRETQIKTAGRCHLTLVSQNGRHQQDEESQGLWRAWRERTSHGGNADRRGHHGEPCGGSSEHQGPSYHVTQQSPRCCLSETNWEQLFVKMHAPLAPAAVFAVAKAGKRPARAPAHERVKTTWCTPTHGAMLPFATTWVEPRVSC